MQALKLHLPDEYEAEDNEGGVFRLRDGTALPPFLAMPRALPLPEWYSMHTPSRVTVLETLSQVARRLEDLHNAGYVHNDIKPANVLLVERAHSGEPRWYITDFTTIAQSGEQVGPFSQKKQKQNILFCDTAKFFSKLNKYVFGCFDPVFIYFS